MNHNYNNEKQENDRWAKVNQLLTSSNGDYRMKQRGNFLREGICPSCHKKSLWAAYPDKPGRVQCDRESKCGYTATAKELFSDLFDPKRIIKTHPATPENRNATADAYLQQVRGFQLNKCKGLYTQENYSYYPREAKDDNLPAEQVTAIRFALPSPMKGSWDRFMDGNHFGKKTYLVAGSRLNSWMWTPKNQTLKQDDTLYITEGIFDALALVHAGKKAAALMGVSNRPEKFIEAHKRLTLNYIIALDNDEAGKKQSPILVKWLKMLGANVSCVQPSDHNDTKKLDWNDLHLAHKLRAMNFEDYGYWGKLLTVDHPKEKALLIVSRENTHAFPMTFNNRVYWVKYSTPKDDREEVESEEKKRTDVIDLQPISTCKPDYLYFQKDIETNDSLYYIRVTKPSTKRRYQECVSPSQLGGASEFDKQLMAIGSGLMWTGNTTQLKRYMQSYWFDNPEPNEVDCVSFVGYAKEFKTYVFKDYAIHNGKLLKANEFDYFDLDSGKQIKTSMSSDPLHLSEHHNPDLWLKDYVTAYGNKGLFALTSWFGSFFAEQIRETSGSLFWTEISGQPGAGKTSVLKFLWKITGRKNYQGVELSKSTISGKWRSLEKAANLPVVLMEGDAGQGEKGHQKKGFDLEEAKGTYEGDGMRITAMKTIGNETREPKFRAALWLAQNEQIQPPSGAGIDSGKAIMERICHAHWDKSHFSEDGRRASERLIDLEMDQVNGFMVYCVKHEAQVIARMRLLQRQWQQKLKQEQDKLTNDRIRFNHSQMLALAEIMVEIGAVPLSADELTALQDFIIERAIARQTTIEYDHPTMVEFWELYEQLCDQAVYRESGKELRGEETVNYAADGNLIAININSMEAVAATMSLRLPLKTELRNLMKNSKRHEFIDYKPCKNPVSGKTRKCYVFKRAA